MIRETAATFTNVEKSVENLTELLSDRRDAFLVAELGGGCAGFITWAPFRPGPGYVHTAEHTIIVANSEQGVGRALIEAAMLRARTQDIHVMVAAIGGENTDAVAFHSRLGFAKTGHLPQVGRKLGRWQDLILMSRILTDP